MGKGGVEKTTVKVGSMGDKERVVTLTIKKKVL